MFLNNFYEYKNWEGIMHHFLFGLIIYCIYIFFIDKKERNLNNILLFTIIIAIDTLLHQNINIRNNKKSNYLL